METRRSSGGAGKYRGCQQRLQAGLQRGEFLGVKILLKVSRTGPGAAGSGTFPAQKSVRGNVLPGEVPDHRAQFVLGVEAQAVVDQVELAGALLEQDVTALAVGVVDQQVEQGHRAQARAGRRV